jgi:hypothetical protein
MRDTLSAFYAILAYKGHRVALLCLGQRMSGQLRVHMPGLIAASPGDTVAIPFQVGGQLRAGPATEYAGPDLELTVEATIVSESGPHVLAVSLGKAT